MNDFLAEQQLAECHETIHCLTKQRDAALADLEHATQRLAKESHDAEEDLKKRLPALEHRLDEADKVIQLLKHNTNVIRARGADVERELWRMRDRYWPRKGRRIQCVMVFTGVSSVPVYSDLPEED